MGTLLLCVWDMAFNSETFIFCYQALKNDKTIWIYYRLI